MSQACLVSHPPPAPITYLTNRVASFPFIVYHNHGYRVQSLTLKIEQKSVSRRFWTIRMVGFSEKIKPENSSRICIQKTISSSIFLPIPGQAQKWTPGISQNVGFKQFCSIFKVNLSLEAPSQKGICP